MINRFVQKALAPNKYVIFYSDWCGYSNKALELLRTKNVPYKRYIIDEIKTIRTVEELVQKLSVNTSLQVNTSHKTRPIIFYDGRFIGGYSDLVEHFTQLYKQ